MKDTLCGLSSSTTISVRGGDGGDGSIPGSPHDVLSVLTTRDETREQTEQDCTLQNSSTRLPVNHTLLMRSMVLISTLLYTTHKRTLKCVLPVWINGRACSKEKEAHRWAL